MEYQYDKDADQLSIKFSGVANTADSGTHLFAVDQHPAIQLILSEEGKLSGLEIATASAYFEPSKLDRFRLPADRPVGNLNEDYKQISASEFSELACPVLFHDKEQDQYFGRIQKGNFTFKFGWLREAPVPAVAWLDNGICAVAADKNLALIDFTSGNVLSNIILDSYFVATYPTADALLIASQLEVLKLDLSTHSITSRFELPDFFVGMDTDRLPYTVQCFDGSTVIIE